MRSYSATVLALLVIAISAFTADSATVSKRPVHPFGIGGILDCGSRSEVVDTRFDGCDVMPCRAVIGNSYRAEVDFRPHASHAKLRLSIILIQAGEEYSVIDVDVPDSAVEGGRSYTFGYNIAITGAFQDDALMLFNLEGNGNVEVICLGITLRVITPP